MLNDPMSPEPILKEMGLHKGPEDEFLEATRREPIPAPTQPIPAPPKKVAQAPLTLMTGLALYELFLFWNAME